MPIRLTPDQARRLGIGRSDAEPVKGARRKGGGPRSAPYHTVCANCGETFDTQAAETRHLNATKHPCYQLVLEFEATP